MSFRASSKQCTETLGVWRRHCAGRFPAWGQAAKATASFHGESRRSLPVPRGPFRRSGPGSRARRRARRRRAGCSRRPGPRRCAGSTIELPRSARDRGDVRRDRRAPAPAPAARAVLAPARRPGSRPSSTPKRLLDARHRRWRRTRRGSTDHRRAACGSLERRLPRHLVRAQSLDELARSVDFSTCQTTRTAAAPRHGLDAVCAGRLPPHQKPRVEAPSRARRLRRR